MPAPTALQRRPEEAIQDLAQTIPLPEDDDLLISTVPSSLAPEVSTQSSSKDAPPVTQPTSSTDTEMPTLDSEGTPIFPASKTPKSAIRIQTRKIPIPPHRYSPLRANWTKIYPPLVEHLGLQVRMNTKSKAVELRFVETPPSSSTPTTTSKSSALSPGASLQKGEDFIRAFALGFEVDDAIALLRLDDLYIETFEIKDVRTLGGEHLGRAIGRIAGKDGKTKFAIENASRTRVVLADSKIHILGGFANIRIAREAVVSLILGKPPGKVYGNLRGVAGRMKERF